MVFQRLFPAGESDAPEHLYTDMKLGDRAPQDRPYVICNFVASLDGKATMGGRTGPLSDASDRAVFHLLRSQADAILVGTGTLRVERYGPLIRKPQVASIRAAESRFAQPLAVVVSRGGSIPYDIPLFGDPASRVALFLPASAPPPADCGARMHLHRTEGGDDLRSVMRTLREDHDVRSLLCEGGPLLFSGLVTEGLVDELFLTLAPTIVGAGEYGVTEGAPVALPVPMRLVWAFAHDRQLFLRYARN